MTKSQLFTKAHKLTKKIIRIGDNYQATFGMCIKFTYTIIQKQSNILNLLRKKDGLTYQGKLFNKGNDVFVEIFLENKYVKTLKESTFKKCYKII